MSFEISELLPPCPICGAKAYVAHIYDSYDSADFGWDAGCPRFKLNDKLHRLGEDSPAADFPRVVSCLSKSQAVFEWCGWVDRWKERHNAS